MIAWTIEAAIDSECFQRILVSTDSEDIAEVAKSYGAEVPFFRDQFADDITPVSQATLSALDQAKEHWDEDYHSVVQLMANCPLRDSTDIRNAVQVFKRKKRQFQISSFKYGWMNPWWAMKVDDNGHPERLFPEALEERSQDLPDLYCPTGAIWIAECDQLRKAGTFYGQGHVLEPISWISAVDIDDYEDLAIAKVLYQTTQSAGN